MRDGQHLVDIEIGGAFIGRERPGHELRSTALDARGIRVGSEIQQRGLRGEIGGRRVGGARQGVADGKIDPLRDAASSE